MHYTIYRSLGNSVYSRSRMPPLNIGREQASFAVSHTLTFLGESEEISPPNSSKIKTAWKFYKSFCP